MGSEPHGIGRHQDDPAQRVGGSARAEGADRGIRPPDVRGEYPR